MVLVSFTSPDALADYEHRTSYQFPVMTDPERAAYRAFGLGRATTQRVWAWPVWKRYAQILRGTGLGALRPAIEDTHQLGGNFIIDADGILSYAYWSQGPEDRPPVQALLDANSAQ